MSFKFEKLDVWQRSVVFADCIFTVTDSFPQRYQFSLGDQLRRAVLSVPTNIAEGSGRDASKESAYFYRIAKGSIYEVVSLLAVAQRHSLIETQACAEHYREANEIAAMLTGLIKSQ
ncbi:MAG: four helix bundle protein [Anaerolineae bacterium]|nr:four helix bundle protein [Anaerolineae bacterium]